MWNALSTHIPGLHCGASTSHTNQNHHYRLQTHPHHLHHNFHHIDGSTETVRDNFGIQGLLDKDCSGEKEKVRRSRFQRHFFQFVGWCFWGCFPQCPFERLLHLAGQHGTDHQFSSEPKRGRCPAQLEGHLDGGRLPSFSGIPSGEFHRVFLVKLTLFELSVSWWISFDF